MKPIPASLLGNALKLPLADERLIQDISTDSRQIEPGSVFVALVGERFDGGDFVREALDKGALYAVTQKKSDWNDPRVLVVDSVRQAFLDIAGAYRDLFSPKIAAVTGSVGKTTTKEFIYAVLSSQYKTLKTDGNQNNQVGLPKTLLRLTDDVQAAVLEMGMSGFGEIRELVLPAKPDAAVITNIGVSHLEYLGSRENILKAKLEITEGLADGSPLFLCADNDLLSRVRDDRLQIVTYGIHNPDSHYRAVSLRQTPEGTRFDVLFEGRKLPVLIPAVGEHNVLNALAAFAVGRLFGVPEELAAAALERYAPSGMRQRVVRHGDLTIIEDCYNASPDSMRAAIAAFSSMSCRGSRIMVLADMLELGEKAPQAHYEIGRLLAQNPIHALYAYGDLAREYVRGARDGGLREAAHFGDKDVLFGALKERLQPEDAVWFKGSRGMKLEEVLQRLYKEC